jgi:hypothetical protein
MPPNLRHNGGVATHAAITPNVGGTAVVPRHHIVRLVAYGRTPPYHLFGGVRVHVTIACFFSASFWFPAGNILIFRRSEPVQILTSVFFSFKFSSKSHKSNDVFYSNLHYI